MPIFGVKIFFFFFFFVLLPELYCMYFSFEVWVIHVFHRYSGRIPALI